MKHLTLLLHHLRHTIRLSRLLHNITREGIHHLLCQFSLRNLNNKKLRNQNKKWKKSKNYQGHLLLLLLQFERAPFRHPHPVESPVILLTVMPDKRE